ncbi:hypothetical protein [Rhizobium leguminosarum]|uniref:hypothetical protein n=1 Tax=Rhizobium leguminosarum TaxID=384 RepID=UPI00102FECFA|nr:hypothetical protein [Rhizobium leguminosarum]TAV40940.1 hypothetical protein ELI29_35925 [Rhizobium leguminosarum]
MKMLRLKRLRNSIRGVRLVVEDGVAVALELNKSPPLSTTAGRNSTSEDGGINLGEKFRKVLKNDSF